jgi:hypothetical protein
VLTASKTNIEGYVVTIMLSSSLHSKGEGPVNHVLVRLFLAFNARPLSPPPQNILKNHRFDMPPGIENNAAKWKKVVTYVQGSFTERRSSWKKIVRIHCLGRLCIDHMSQQLKRSVEEKLNIYDVTALLTKKSGCKVTAPLCAHVALMVS